VKISSLRKHLPADFARELLSVYKEREARSLANWVIEDVTGKPAMKVLTGNDDEWSTEDAARIENILGRLKEGEPVQYILGYSFFYGLVLDVGPGVLIPRGETEELVEWVISEWENKSRGCRILDIGCGSGAIALALAKNLPDAEIFAVDISENAVRTCLHNAEKLNLKVTCGLMDIMEPSGKFAGVVFDVIVSNPPYVLESQKPFMEKWITEHEPDMALFVPDNDPIVFYSAISEFGENHLKPGGNIFVEINELLGRETIREFEMLFSTVELKKDISGKNRMIMASHGI